jgi:hypothetical protein
MAREGADPDGPAGDWTAAAELAPMTDVWHRLLDAHVPNSAGRCRACTQGGTGIPTTRWPCGPRKIAEAAARCHVVRTDR